MIMTTEEAISILWQLLSYAFNSGGERGEMAVAKAVDALRKMESIERIVKEE